ncbi:hypothetical protein ISCGN_026988 [Ixodes scapularis]
MEPGFNWKDLHVHPDEEVPCRHRDGKDSHEFVKSRRVVGRRWLSVERWREGCGNGIPVQPPLSDGRQVFPGELGLQKLDGAGDFLVEPQGGSLGRAATRAHHPIPEMWESKVVQHGDEGRVLCIPEKQKTLHVQLEHDVNEAQTSALLVQKEVVPSCAFYGGLPHEHGPVPVYFSGLAPRAADGLSPVQHGWVADCVAHVSPAEERQVSAPPGRQLGGNGVGGRSPHCGH